MGHIRFSQCRHSREHRQEVKGGTDYCRYLNPTNIEKYSVNPPTGAPAML